MSSISNLIPQSCPLPGPRPTLPWHDSPADLGFAFWDLAFGI